MALSMAHDFSIAVPATVASARTRSNRPRRITPQAGRALEILGHAIEYLKDENMHRGVANVAARGEFEAVQLLMGLNREVYFECPQQTSLGDRLRSLFHLQVA